MKAAIMQPYFFPYIGYFQLIASVDVFIIYDNIKYTKKGWINRNRILVNDHDAPFTLPLKNGSDALNVCEREIAADFDCSKLAAQVKGAYAKAPQFNAFFPMLEEILGHPDSNLFSFLFFSLKRICDILGITTNFIVSSTLSIDHGLRGHDKVIALCQAVQAETYVNAIGGRELYSRDAFRAQGIELKFLRSRPFSYPQLGGTFVPWLSIIDVLMFHTIESTRDCIQSNYELI